MKQEIPFTDAELRELAARVSRGEESPDAIDLLSDDEANRLMALTSRPGQINVGEGSWTTMNEQPVLPDPPKDNDSFLRGVAERTLPFTSLNEAKALGKMVASGPMFPKQLAEGAVAGVRDQFGQMKQAVQQGKFGQAAIHGVGMVPLVGPMIAETAELYPTQPRRAVGQTMGLLAPGAILKSARALKSPTRAASLAASAKKSVIQALDPRKERWKAEANRIAEEAARRGIRGSREDVVAAAREGTEAAGRKIEDYWDARGDDAINTGPMVGELELSKQQFQNVIKDPTGKPIRVVDLDPDTISRLTELQQLIEEHGTTISAQNARRLLQNWAEPVALAGGYSHRAPGSMFVTDLGKATELWAKREGADAIRQVLGEANPDIRAINAEYTFQRRLRDIGESTLARTSSHKTWGLGTRALQAGGAAGGAVVGNAIAGPAGAGIGAVIGGEGLARLARVFEGPRWKLFDARRKMRLADAIASGNEARIRSAVGATIAFDQQIAQATHTR